MPTTDLNNGYDSIESQISAYKTFKETVDAYAELKKTVANSSSQSVPDLAQSLDKVAEQQKRFLRNAPTSFDELLKLLSATQGSGNQSSSKLRKLLLETTVKEAKPKILEILAQSSLKALGCSQEQTYVGISESTLELNPLDTLPASQGIYVPLHSLDFGGLLKIPTNSIAGKILFGKEQPNVIDGVYKPYKGPLSFPMLKEMSLRLNGVNQSYKGQYGKFYQGTSDQKLFDFQYSKTNRFGVTEDCLRVALIDRFPSPFAASAQTTSSGIKASGNKVYEFFKDYYSTIEIYDSARFAAVLVNLVSGALDMELKPGFNDLEQSSKFELLIQRILGLCFDKRSEIDVSGVSKIAELDGVDESFFEFTEVDLRNIENKINNIQNNVIEFVDCGNVKLPVDYTTINNELLKFRDSLSAQTVENQVASIEGILDTISNNPEWYNVEARASFDQSILKKIPVALASAVLTPANLLPLFVMLQVVESSGITSYNSAITSANTIIQSGNTINGSLNNVVNNPIDFVKVFEKFNIDVVSKIGAVYIETLFNLLKKELLTLVQDIIKKKEKAILKKDYLTIKSLLNVSALILGVAAISSTEDFRKCKSLVDKIQKILQLLSKVSKKTRVPAPLLFLSPFLPGTSAETAFINTIQELQSIGIPTGPLPDGSPNQMLLYNYATHLALEKDKAENNKIQAIGTSAFGPVQIFGI